jgi:membrane-bound metal-dependent hydrolase YbcI (DUF457 family)
MANFTTHIAVGTVVSGGFATLTLAADVIAPENLVAVTLAGVLGSILPDIDLKDSRPSRAMFSGLAVFLSFAVLFGIAYNYSVAEMWFLWLGTLMLVRYGVHALFHHFSYHRGIWHSLLAGLFFWFLTAIVFKYALDRPDGVAWLAGAFMFAGYVTHLALDEIYSVDVTGAHVKRSFGTALKFIDRKRWADTAVVAAATVLLFVLTPPSATFVDGLTSRQLWVGLQQRLLPANNNWFGLVGDIAWGPGQNGSVSAVTTGTLPPAAGAEKTAPR